MSKIETTSKVSLKLTSKINPRRRGAHVPSPQFWTQPTSPSQPGKGHPAQKGLFPGEEGPIAPTGTTEHGRPTPQPPRPQKQPQIAIQTISKTETSKAPLKPISRKTQEGKARTCWAPDFGHSPQDTPQSRKGYPQALQDCKSGHKCQS